jgi:hypothetical protein
VVLVVVVVVEPDELDTDVAVVVLEVLGVEVDVVVVVLDELGGVVVLVLVLDELGADVVVDVLEELDAVVVVVLDELGEVVVLVLDELGTDVVVDVLNVLGEEVVVLDDVDGTELDVESVDEVVVTRLLVELTLAEDVELDEEVDSCIDDEDEDTDTQIFVSANSCIVITPGVSPRAKNTPSSTQRQSIVEKVGSDRKNSTVGSPGKAELQ